MQSLLKALCEASLAETLHLENAVDTVLLADLYNAAQLREQALQFINSNGASIVKRKDSMAKLKRNPDLMEVVMRASLKTYNMPESE